ncbi:MAG: hypothetical protein R3A12_04840 [Ignavibacteria bacterium]|nr:hypothetical protein [Ignavibacteriota bacterium]
MKFFRFGLVLLGSIVFINTVFSQNIKGKNYEVESIDKNCRTGFYLSNNLINVNSSYPNPFSPNKNDDVVFGVPDSSDIKVRIFSFADNETIVKFELRIGAGCYKINWIDQNTEKLKSGTYFCSFEAAQKNSLIISNFNAVQKIVLIK